jgi:hypothetical protein
MTSIEINEKLVFAAATAMNYVDAGLQYVHAAEGDDLDISTKAAAIIAAGTCELARRGCPADEIEFYMNAAVNCKLFNANAGSTPQKKAVYNSFHKA